MTPKNAPTQKKKVLLVDDHPIVRQGLTLLINREPDLVVCGEADSVAAALEAIKATGPDIAVVDLTLKDSNGLDLIRTLEGQQRKLPILVLSMHRDFFYVERVLRAGVMGFLAKAEAAEVVLTAIRRVLSGAMYLSDEMARSLIGKLVVDRRHTNFSVDRLSDREMEVFELLGKGNSTRAVAQKLKLGIKTVETHRAKIKQKLNLSTAPELVQRAIQWNQLAQQNQ
jgi:DNA-binding NarL/FixJ family response regulator